MSDADELHAGIQGRSGRCFYGFLVAFDWFAVGVEQRALHGGFEDDEGLVVEGRGELDLFAILAIG